MPHVIMGHSIRLCSDWLLMLKTRLNLRSPAVSQGGCLSCSFLA